MSETLAHRGLKALVFDFDGTLAELNIDFKAMARAVMDLAASLGLGEVDEDLYLLEKIDAYHKRSGDGFYEKAHSLIREREVEAAHQARLFPFTRKLLAAGRGLDLNLAVISRNCGEAIRTVFNDIEDAVDVFLPREEARLLKPHPGHVLLALEELGVPPHQAVMVGDHPTDMQSGRAAGVYCVGVASGRMREADLEQAGADLVLPDASTLLKALNLDGPA